MRHALAKMIRAAALAGIAGLVAAAGPAKAQTVDFAVWYSDRDMYAPIMKAWAAEIEKRTQGRVKMNLQFSGALVAAKDTLNAVRSGAVGGGTTSASFVIGLVRELAYVEPFFWIPDKPDVASKIVKEVDAITSPLLEKHGIKNLFSYPSAGLIVACTNAQIKTLADWKGKKIRTAGRWQGLQLRALGASAIAIDPGELYIALQNKTVDCTMFLSNLALSGKIYEVAPYITYLREGANSSLYYMNLDLWNKISPTDQKTIMEISADVVKNSGPHVVEEQQRALGEMEKLGAKVYRATDADLAALKKQLAPVWDEIAKTVGPTGDPVREILKQNM
jgi:TRAP-type C4-dicarboxylate transport system substrate-binding protein